MGFSGLIHKQTKKRTKINEIFQSIEHQYIQNTNIGKFSTPKLKGLPPTNNVALHSSKS